MKKFNYYLVDEVKNGEQWTIYAGTDLKTAETILNNIAPKDCDALELLGTDEEPDTYTTAETLKRLYIGTAERPAAAFTDQELSLLSAALINAIQEASEARRNLQFLAGHRIEDDTPERLERLNNKVCMMMQSE